MSKKKEKKAGNKDKPPPLSIFFSTGKPDARDRKDGDNSLATSEQITETTPAIDQHSQKEITRNQHTEKLVKRRQTARKKKDSGPASESLINVINRSLIEDTSSVPGDEPIIESVPDAEIGKHSLFFESDNEPTIYIASYNFLQEHFDQVFRNDNDKEIWLLTTVDTIPGYINGELLARIGTGYGEILSSGELLDGVLNGSLDWTEFEKDYYDNLGRQYTLKPHIFREIVNISISGEGRIVLACHLSPKRQCSCQVLAEFLYEMSSYELGKKLVIKRLG